MSRRPGGGARRAPRVRGAGTLHLALRQVVTDRLAVATVVLIVLVCSLLAAAVPRALDAVHTDGLRQAVADASPAQRDLSIGLLAAPPSQPGDQPLTPLRELLREARDDLPEQVRALTGEPMFSATYGDLGGSSVTPVLAPPKGVLDWEVTTLGDVDRHVRYLVGRAPRAATTTDLPGAPTAPAGGFDLDPPASQRTVVEVAVSAATAADAGVEPGSQVDLPGNLDLHVVGVFGARDPGSPRWGWDAAVLEPPVVVDPGRGDIYQPVAVVAEQSWPAVEHQIAYTRRPHLRMTVPVTQAGVLQARDAAGLLTEVREVEERSLTAADTSAQQIRFVPGLERFRLGTNLDLVLAGHLHAQAASTAVVSLVVTGLLGVSLGLLALAARLVVERRRRALALTVARGASPAQVRSLMVLEGLLLGAPAAAAGGAVAVAAVPGHSGAAGWLLPAVLGLAPAVLLPGLARPGGLRTVRRDSTGTRARRLRLAAEALTVLLAVTAVVLLRTRGLDGGGFQVVGGVVTFGSGQQVPSTGVDPLLAAAPVLVALAAALLLARWYPRPVAALATAMSRRAGAVPFLGAARAGRDTTGGTLPLVVLLLALATSVFGTVVAATSEHGARTAAWQQLGAPARLTGIGFSAQDVALATQDPDVAAAAALGWGPATATGPTREATVTVAAVDATALADVQRDVPDAPPLDLLAQDAPGDAVPVLASPGLGDVGDTLTVASGQFRTTAVVVATAESLPGVLTDRNLVVADRQRWSDAGGDLPAAGVVGLRLRAGADPGQVQERLRAALGTSAPLTTQADAVHDVRERPLVTGTLTAFPLAAALAALVSGAAVVLTLVVGAPERSRLLSRLRTLGLAQRQARRLVVWEVAPLVVVAVVGGLVTGLLTAWWLVPAVDLRAFTGGSAQPAVAVDAGSVALVLGGFLAVTAVLVAVAVAANRRLRLGAVLRVGDET